VPPPAHVASLSAALLASVPATIRLIESLDARAPGWLFALWLLSWAVTSGAILWTALRAQVPDKERTALAVIAAAMMLALVCILAIPASGSVLFASLSSLPWLAASAAIAGLGVLAWERGLVLRVGLAGAALATIAMIGLTFSFTMGEPRPWQLGFHLAIILLGCGLSLAMGQYGTRETPAAASQEP
jgi:hypothetical protein